MRLLILGANGKTGTQLIELALARGHEVTAFVRSPAKITRRHPLLQVQRGDSWRRIAPCIVDLHEEVDSNLRDP